jgi:hypothetical protein
MLLKSRLKQRRGQPQSSLLEKKHNFHELVKQKKAAIPLKPSKLLM